MAWLATMEALSTTMSRTLMLRSSDVIAVVIHGLPQQHSRVTSRPDSAIRIFLSATPIRDVLNLLNTESSNDRCDAVGLRFFYTDLFAIFTDVDKIELSFCELDFTGN